MKKYKQLTLFDEPLYAISMNGKKYKLHKLLDSMKHLSKVAKYYIQIADNVYILTPKNEPIQEDYRYLCYDVDGQVFDGFYTNNMEYWKNKENTNG